MPRIADMALDGVAFMYPSVQHAEERARMGGSGFFVGREIKGSRELAGRPLYSPYLISNRHVVFDGGACVATVNRRDGGPPDIWDLDHSLWFAHPDGDDLAAYPVTGLFERGIHKATFINEEKFITPFAVDGMKIGIGEDVFMVGRFINLQGKKTNIPAVRFGNISVMNTPVPVSGPGGKVRNQESYAVEMRSRTGFSGAPVFVYRNPGTARMDLPEGTEQFAGLLGVNWGYIKDEEGENTFLNGVVPAWKITELLNTPALLAAQEFNEKDVLRRIEEAARR